MATTEAVQAQEQSGPGNAGKEQPMQQMVNKTPVKSRVLADMENEKPTPEQWKHSLNQDPEWKLELMDKDTTAKLALQQQGRAKHPLLSKLKKQWHPSDAPKDEMPLPEHGSKISGRDKRINLSAAVRAGKLVKQGVELGRTFGGAQFRILRENGVHPKLCGIFRQMKNKQPLCMGNVVMDNNMWKVRTKCLYYCKFGRTRKNGVVYVSYASCINSFILGIHDPTKWKGQHYTARQFDKLTWARDVKYLMRLPEAAKHEWTNEQFNAHLMDQANHSNWEQMVRTCPPRVIGSLRGFYSEHYTDKMKHLMCKARGEIGEKGLKMALLLHIYSVSIQKSGATVSLLQNRRMFSWLMARKAICEVAGSGLDHADDSMWDTGSMSTGSRETMSTGSTFSGGSSEKSFGGQTWTTSSGASTTSI